MCRIYGAGLAVRVQGGYGLGLGFSHQRRNLVYEKVVGQVIPVARILGEGIPIIRPFFGVLIIRVAHLEVYKRDPLHLKMHFHRSCVDKNP